MTRPNNLFLDSKKMELIFCEACIIVNVSYLISILNYPENQSLWYIIGEIEKLYEIYMDLICLINVKFARFFIHSIGS